MGAKASAAVCGVDDKARDLVVFVGNDRFVEELGERKIGERHLRGDAFGCAGGGYSGQFISAARRRRPGEQRAQVIK